MRTSGLPRSVSGLIVVGLLACGDGGTGPKNTRIGTEGGVATLAGGAITLTVPPDALSGFVEFTATPTHQVPDSDVLA